MIPMGWEAREKAVDRLARWLLERIASGASVRWDGEPPIYEDDGTWWWHEHSTGESCLTLFDPFGRSDDEHVLRLEVRELPPEAQMIISAFVVELARERREVFTNGALPPGAAGALVPWIEDGDLAMAVLRWIEDQEQVESDSTKG